MDSFGWDNPTAATSEMNFSPCMWGNRQNETSQNSLQSSVAYGIIGGNVDLPEAFFNSSEGLHGVKTSSETRKLDVVSDMVRQVLLPPSQISSTSAAVEVSQCQEALWLAAAAELTALEADSPWRDAVTSSLGNLAEGFGLGKEPQVHISIVDEQDVSAILSNCDNIPNKLSCSGNVSSGESEHCSSHRSDKGSDHGCSNVDEVVSQGSSDPDAVSHLMPAQSRPDLKRKDRGLINEGSTGEGRICCDNILQSDSSTTENGFRIFFESQSKEKKPKLDKYPQRGASSIDFRLENGYEPDAEAIAQVKEMIYRAAAMRPVSLGTVESVERPKRKNVRISSDPQTVAARHRRERISERLRVLQRLVPGGSKMDTASMLDEAANYLKFLKSQVVALETLGQGINGSMTSGTSSPSSLTLSSSLNQSTFPMQSVYPQMQTLVQGLPQKGAPTRVPYHLQF